MGIGNIANTGMQASMSDMEVTSNNIANAGTYGFKKSYVTFADLYPVGSGAGNQIGLGVAISSIGQNFASGGFQYTGNSMDISIKRDGFFVMRDSTSGETTYTRNGQFAIDENGYITSTDGVTRVQGFPATNGVISPGAAPTDLQVDYSPIPAVATTSISTKVNLNSTSNAISATFDPLDTSTYNYKSETTVYDSLGNSTALSLYYIKTAANTWTVQAQIGGATIGTGSLAFDTSGQLTSSTGLNALSFSPTTGAASPQTFAVDMTGSTQFGSGNSVNLNQPNGYPAGTVSSYSIDQDGLLTVSYSNGQKIPSGQIAIATFQAPQGLAQAGKMSWTATTSSGPANINQTSSSGNFNPQQLELSNVDLTQELINLIGSQHNFQANAQVEQTYNEIMQTVIQL